MRKKAFLLLAYTDNMYKILLIQLYQRMYKRSCSSLLRPDWRLHPSKGNPILSMGSVAMGIAGSIVDASFFQDYLGMRNEYIDMSEFIRRIDEEIYDKD